MTVTEHPGYQEEKQKLQGIVSYIEDFIASQKTPIESQGATSWAAVNLSQKRLAELERMKLARQELYFGRVDVQFVDSDQPEPLYIGKHSVPEMGIFNWKDTKAADYYYTLKSDQDDKLLLKRTFTIERDTLRRIIDDFVDPKLADELNITVDEFTDQLLLDLLKESRGSQLHDIVATIQQQQYQIIQSPLEQLLVVQGVPGSGKTQIALHRISYLLYHHQNDNRMVPNRVLILGPNPIFMKYIGNVLPALGNRRLLQRTFDDWLLERLGDTLNYETQDESLESLLGHNLEQADRIMHYRNAQVKGSLRMAQLLEQYVAWLHQQVLNGRTDFKCEVRILGQQWGPVTISLEQMQEFLDETRNLPFNLRREEVERQLLRHIFQKMTNQSLSSEINDDLRKQIRDSISEQLRDYFNDWSHQNVLVAYRRLLRNVEILRQASTDILDMWEQELLIQDAPTARIPFRFSDLAALLYFKLLMDGTEGTIYDYIVVDEAQDLTPLHFKVLFAHSRNGAMTVLGDLAQSIYPHHRLNSWDDLSVVAPIAPKVETIRQSYRSTKQITDFANNLLKRITPAKDYWAEPIARNGSAPQKKAFREAEGLSTYLLEAVQKELDNGHQSIALVAKTVSACKTVAEILTQRGFNEYELIDDRNAIYKGGVVIIPAYLTKGLEFDTLILTDADELTYPLDHLHAYLLYVVVTRAAHTLHICWTGTLTPMLDDTSEGIILSPFLSNHIEYNPVTIATYVQHHQPAYTMDWCVERLAGADKLNLLKEGRIDRTLLDILLNNFTTTTTPTARVQPDMPAPSLSHSLRQTVTSQAINLATSSEPSVAQALILSQIVFNLLRNHMRQVGLSLPDDRLPTLPEQMVGLVTLFKALKEEKVNLNAGRWTTRKRALNGFGRDKQDGVAQRLLQLLIQYGIVEEKADTLQIRVPLQQIEPLLALALGRSTNLWEEQFFDEIQLLPEPIAVVQERDSNE